MGFFEPPPPPEPEPQPDRRQPPWAGPPDNIVGQPVVLDPVVFRGDRVAVVVSGFVAYPTGVELMVSVRARESEEDLWPFGPESFHRRRGRSADGGGLPDDLLRFGVLFADGATATTLGGPDPWRIDPDEEPTGPLLAMRSGSGGGNRWDQEWWLWPLPPPGRLVLVVEWPARGIPETRAELDAGALVEGAALAVALWPADRPDAPVMGGSQIWLH